MFHVCECQSKSKKKKTIPNTTAPTACNFNAIDATK